MTNRTTTRPQPAPSSSSTVTSADPWALISAAVAIKVAVMVAVLVSLGCTTHRCDSLSGAKKRRAWPPVIFRCFFGDIYDGPNTAVERSNHASRHQPPRRQVDGSGAHSCERVQAVYSDLCGYAVTTVTCVREVVYGYAPGESHLTYLSTCTPNAATYASSAVSFSGYGRIRCASAAFSKRGTRLMS